MTQARPFTPKAIDALPLQGWDQFSTPLGKLTALFTDAGLAGLWFDFEQHYGGKLQLPHLASHAMARQTRDWMACYWQAGTQAAPPPTLDLHGTTHQRAVWAQLQSIHAGETRSYGEIASALGRPSAARAVGMAVGANPVVVMVPCHRVVGYNGQLTGYASGLARKEHLLRHEGALPKSKVKCA